MEKNNFIKDGEIAVYADPTIFSRETILKCLYWFGDKFHTAIAQHQQYFLITLKPLPNAQIAETDLDYYLQKFERDLVDHHLRNIVLEETRNIRDLLVAKAFSNGEFDEAPPGEISDSVGFDPSFNHA